MPRLTAEQHEGMIADYLRGMDTHRIGWKYGIQPGSAWEFLHRRGLTRSPSASRRRYARNDHAFDEITPDSAYWIGLLMTDGCVRHRPGNPDVVLTLGEADIEHVRAFARFAGYDGPVRLERSKSHLGGPMARVEICSAPICEALAKRGVTYRKTRTARAIGLENNPHFWRGCIDGDGTIGIYCQNRRYGYERPVVVMCSASSALLDQFITFVSAVSPASRLAISGHHRQGSRIVMVTGRHAIDLVRAVYAPPGPALPRKAAIASKIIARANANPAWCRRCNAGMRA